MDRYRGPQGESMLGWGDIYALFDDYGTDGAALGRLLIAILGDDYKAAELECQAISRQEVSRRQDNAPRA